MFILYLGLTPSWPVSSPVVKGGGLGVGPATPPHNKKYATETETMNTKTMEWVDDIKNTGAMTDDIPTANIFTPHDMCVCVEFDA